MRLLGVHPGPLMYSKIFLRLEPIGLELIAAAGTIDTADGSTGSRARRGQM